MATAYVGLGGNLGDREGNLALARERLAAAPDVELRRVSSLYETDPVGGPPQPPYLNQVVELATDLDPYALLGVLQQIEMELGRVREVRWGPRTVDLDLLLYEGFTSLDPVLTVPHPRLLERQFVLIPLADIAPGLLLSDGRTAAQAAQLEAPEVRRIPAA
ncbi:MAG TPA: 2-amino-4-hydroxy-6-hydroxymethyldihydropteridine diphosphokinase [Armatimonadota bacterium]|jgi:2-amino-4-hydroxy-6-hydroxymethyldihydropteridine diphosphokinase